MAQFVIVPRMGQTMTEGLVAKWYVKDGDHVVAGDDIYELEYDKSTASIQAKQDGTVRLLCNEGDTIPLGGAVAVILGQGEEFDESLMPRGQGLAPPDPAKKNPVVSQEPSVKEKPEAQSKDLHVSPMVRAYAKKMGVELSEVVRRGDRVSKEDIDEYLKARQVEEPQAAARLLMKEDSGGIRISPIAKKMAEERGIEPADITPSDGKRITKEDVLAYKPVQTRSQPDPAQGRREPVRGMRRVIAENMAKSYFHYPTVTLTTDVNMASLLELRSQLNEELDGKEIKLTITDMLIKAVAMALMDNEIVNTSLIDDEIVYHGAAHIGVAVALEQGLVVPVIRNAHLLDFKEISVESKRLIDLAKSGSLEPADMHGSTFTVTNLGTLDIDAFNPIINYPESAILGVGRTVEKPVVRNGKIEVEPRAVLSLTHDHRVIDGAPAAYFLKSVVKYIERPFLLLMDRD